MQQSGRVHRAHDERDDLAWASSPVRKFRILRVEGRSLSVGHRQGHALTNGILSCAHFTILQFNLTGLLA
ncbi:unnamed protein product, partial [Mycena citricolor]